MKGLKTRKIWRKVIILTLAKDASTVRQHFVLNLQNCLIRVEIAKFDTLQRHTRIFLKPWLHLILLRCGLYPSIWKFQILPHRACNIFYTMSIKCTLDGPNSCWKSICIQRTKISTNSMSCTEIVWHFWDHWICYETFIIIWMIVFKAIMPTN